MKSAAIVILTSFVCIVALAAQQAPPFRAAVDLIAVDVQVVDKEGAPMADLRPGQFTVTIDGKARKVVSADLVSLETTAVAAPHAGETPPAPSPTPAAAVQPRRVYILAVDAMSFQAGEIAPALEAARDFIARLRPNDLVGLTVFPRGPTVNVSTDHTQILAALGRVVGQADAASMDPYGLSPSTVVDFTGVDVALALRDFETFRRNDPQLAQKLVLVCHDPPERASCFPDVVGQSRLTAQSQENQARERMSSLRATLKSLDGTSPHKIVVLVSAGVMSADRGGGRPNVGDVGRLVGQAAAEANAAVYTLFFDRLASNRLTSAGSSLRPADAARDSAILSRPLEQIADKSGGAFVRIAQGSGDFAFDRILKETAAYYLLGVEVDPRDRDGRPRELRIRVDARDATVRGRAWVVIPPPPALGK